MPLEPSEAVIVPPPREKGRRILRVSDVFLPTLFGDGEHLYRVVEGGLPADARVVNCRMDFNGHYDGHTVQTLVLLIESAGWGPSPEDEPIPELDVTFQQIHPATFSPARPPRTDHAN